jgi:hypothetical protein
MTKQEKRLRNKYFKERYWWLEGKRVTRMSLHKRGEAPKSLLRDV